MLTSIHTFGVGHMTLTGGQFGFTGLKPQIISEDVQFCAIMILNVNSMSIFKAIVN